MATAKSSRADKVAMTFAIGVAILVISSFVVPRAKPRLAGICYRMGTISLATENYGSAISWFDRAISMKPDFARAYCGRGVARIKGLHQPGTEQTPPANADFDLALKDFAIAIQLDPRSAEAYYDRGYSYWMENQNEPAIQNFDQAIRIDPEYSDAYFARGHFHRDQKQYDLAVLDFSSCIRIHPTFTPAYNARSDAYDHAGKFDLAIEDDNAIIRMQPQSGEGWNGRCWHRAIIGRLPEALADCKQALVLTPNDPATLDSLGFVYLKMKKSDLAIENYDAALAQIPRQATSLYGKGMAEFQEGDPNAADDLDAAAEIQPDIADEFARMGVPPISKPISRKK